MKRFFVTALVLVVLGGCGSAAQSPPAGDRGDPDEPISGPPSGGNVSPGRGAQRVTPRPGMDDLRRAGWEKMRPTEGGRSLDVYFYSGVEPCEVLDHVDVRETRRIVRVTLYIGSDPRAGNVACIELARLNVVEIRLDEPLGDRRVVDGAA